MAAKPKKKKKAASDSVGICVYVDNRPDLARLTINCLLKNTTGKSVSFHVVCDSCDDYTVKAVSEMVESAGKGWEFSSVVLGSRMVATLDVAKKMVSDGASRVCLVDGDLLVPPGWLSSMKACMDETGAALVFPLSNKMTSGCIAMSGARRAAKRLKPMSWLQASSALSGRKDSGSHYPEAHRPDPACCLMSAQSVTDFDVPDEAGSTGCILSRLLFEGGLTAFVDDGIYCYHFSASLADRAELLSYESQLLYSANPSLELDHRRTASVWGGLVSDYAAIKPTPPTREKGVVFSSSSINHYGGISSVVDLSNSLQELGLDVELNYINEDYNLHDIRCRAVRFRNISLIKSRSNAACLSAGAIVATHWSSAPFVISATENSSSLIPIAYWQDREDLCSRVGGGSFVTAECKKEYVNIIQKVATSDHVISSAEKDLGAAAFRKIPEGVDVNLFYPPSSRPDRIRVLSLLRNSVVHKGADVVAQVYSDLKETHGDKISLEIFGERSRCPAIDVSHKRLTRPKLAALMREVHIVVCASSSEGFGVIGLEAMASGAAFVTLANGGIAEYGINEKNCLIVKADEMSAAIAMLADSPALRDTLGAAGRETALEFSVDRCAGAWFEYLSSIFNPPPKPKKKTAAQTDPLQG